MFSTSDFLDLTETAHTSLFDGIEFVWETLKKIGPYLSRCKEWGNHGQMIGTNIVIGNQVYIGKGTTIEPGVYIQGPAWIGEGCEIRVGAYIRENVIIGNECVLGNSCEFKNCVLFNGCQVPHFSYVGDSILGAKAHLGAGVILSNFKLTKDEIVVRHDGKVYPTGLRKFGAIIGDRAEIGCHAVLNPGSLVGRDSLIYSGAQWRGYLPEKQMAKLTSQVQIMDYHPRK